MDRTDHVSPREMSRREVCRGSRNFNIHRILLIIETQRRPGDGDGTLGIHVHFFSI